MDEEEDVEEEEEDVEEEGSLDLPGDEEEDQQRPGGGLSSADALYVARTSSSSKQDSTRSEVGGEAIDRIDWASAPCPAADVDDCRDASRPASPLPRPPRRLGPCSARWPRWEEEAGPRA